MSKTYSIYTLGCRVNHYESQAIAEKLEKMGYIQAKDGEISDVCIVNTCAVTAESEKKSRQLTRRVIRDGNGKVIVTGCSAQINPEVYKKTDGVYLVFGTRNKTQLCDYLDKESEEKIICDGFDNTAPLCPSFITKFDRVRAYVKIEDGCNAKCAYCVIPKARGTVISRDESEIIEEIKALAESSCREVVLTGIETSDYSPSLSKLIEKVNKIKGIERIRLGSLDPASINNSFLEVVSDCEHFMPHFHLSLQSGSSGVLARMRRKYNAEMALNKIADIRNYFPNVCLSADIICGFPGETEREFEETVEFIKKAKLLHAHIFPYSKREGTEAYSMSGQIDESIKKERCAHLASVQKEIEDSLLNDYVNKTKAAKILVESYENGIASGHTENFIEAEVLCNNECKGKIINISPDSVKKGIIYGKEI